MDARTQHSLALARENVTAARLSLMVALRHIGTGGPEPDHAARKIRTEVAASLADAASAETLFAETFIMEDWPRQVWAGEAWNPHAHCIAADANEGAEVCALCGWKLSEEEREAAREVEPDPAFGGDGG